MAKRRTTLWAILWHHECLLAAITFLNNRTENFRNDIAGLTQHNCVANQNAFGLHDVLVVQGCKLDNRASHLDRFDNCVRSSSTGSTNRNSNIEQLGVHLLWRVLVGDGPARCAAGEAKLCLLCKGVELHNHAVDFVLEIVAVGFEVVDVGLNIGRRVDNPVAVGGWQTPRRQQLIEFALLAEPRLFPGSDAVHQHSQRATCGYARVFLTQ